MWYFQLISLSITFVILLLISYVLDSLLGSSSNFYILLFKYVHPSKRWSCNFPLLILFMSFVILSRCIFSLFIFSSPYVATVFLLHLHSYMGYFYLALLINVNVKVHNICRLFQLSIYKVSCVLYLCFSWTQHLHLHSNFRGWFDKLYVRHYCTKWNFKLFGTNGMLVLYILVISAKTQDDLQTTMTTFSRNFAILSECTRTG